MEEFKIKYAGLKVIVSEVDGIITEDLMPIDELGNVLFKNFCMKDFEAINHLRKVYKFVFLSRDNLINYHLCKRKQIPFFHAPRDKKKKLVEILRRYEATPEEILYIGCKYSDLECMKMAQISFCPEDSVASVKNVADHVLPIYGGTGVICMLYDLLKPVMINR